MKKSIFLFDNLSNAMEINKYFLTKEKAYKKDIIYVESDPAKYHNDKFYRLTDKVTKVKKIGFRRLISSMLNKKSIVVSGSPATYQKYLSNKIIFLNHGWGTKSTPGNNEINNPKVMKNYENTLKNLNYIICLSEFDSTYYLKHEKFKKIPEPKFIPLGSPRNDYLIKHKNSKSIFDNLSKEFKINKANKKVLLFSPTHRDNYEKNIKLLNEIIEQLSILDRELDEKGYVILFRPHYFSGDVRERIEKLKNIKYAGFDKYKDVRPLMIYSDLLITDYSSIFVDYLLLDKPIVYYIPDLDEYSSFRGLVIDYDNPLQTPGPKIKEFKEILHLQDNDFLSYDLEESKHFFHKYTDDQSTKRIVEFIKKQYNAM
ncbi:CDP-glycerol glycerophosphotransferase family protein [Priestia megaterium]|uniref:CDP-glycerol glycerophosphotransferase family protein n=1 Tax=Priestia megaterium TaxID=1404 RepID=UPI0030C98928